MSQREAGRPPQGTTWAFPPPPPPSLAILATTQRFPVARIWCVGRNYAAHAREMGSDPDREPPFFFAKPSTSLVIDGRVPYPPATADLQHEVELVVALRAGGRDITAETALDHVFGYAVGVDLTRRDLQHDAKKHGRPWDMAKGFDGAAPCSVLAPVASVGHPDHGSIVLAVNGIPRQRGDLRDMIWSVAETIAALSRLVTLHPGDLIFTGTPEGVGPVHPGDELTCAIEGLPLLTVTIAPAT